MVHLSEISDRSKVNRLGKIYLENNTKNIKYLTKKFSKIIYFSSSSVYGYRNDRPCNELSKVYKSDFYNKNKLNIEKHIIKNNGIVIRLSNVLGKNMINKNIVNDIIKQMNKKKITLLNQNVIIDYIDIDDVCSATEKLILSNKKGIFNLGIGKGISVIKLVKLISKIYNLDNKEIIGKKFSKNLIYNVLNVNKIKKSIKWKPKKTLIKSLKEICERD